MASNSTTEVVGDHTDPNGTLRPDLPPEPAPGSQFIPLNCPPFDHQKHIPPNTIQPYHFFNLYLTREDIDSLVITTNARGLKREDEKWEKGFKDPRRWSEVCSGEIYIYLGILVLMGIHPEFQISSYWSKKPGMARYLDISSVMSLKRWEAIHRNFYISDYSKKLSDFEKV